MDCISEQNTKRFGVLIMATFQEHCKNVLSKVDISKLEKLKQKYSKNDLKYLNYSFEIPYKMTWATRYLMLEFQQKKDILDLGCGPGWFPFIAKHFGHNVKCCDIPNEAGESAILFEEILHALDLKKDYPFYIKPQEKIPSKIGRFDIITGLGMAFHHGWHINDWYFFLDDIIYNHLKPNTDCCIYFQVNRNAAWIELEQDVIYKKKPEIKKWEMFESHMLRAIIRT